MKIRTGFVSNSSSSSFLIWGIYINQNKYPNIDSDMFEQLEDSSLYQSEFESRNFYLGQCPTKCKDNQTMKEFKEEINKAILDLLQEKNIPITEIKPGWHEDAWYDG